jgi:radical SAM superfamily enzyme with C-terminal helix-hairpin-helix motif
VRRRAAVVLLVGAVLTAGCGVVRFGAPGAIDLNAADPGAIAVLPGLTAEDGQRIVANRPYVSKDDLLRRHVVGEQQYAAIADLVYVGPPGMPDYLRATPPQPEGP